MVYAGQRAEKSQRGMHLNAAGERRSSGSQSAASGAAAQRMGAPRARMRPLAAGVWRVVRSLLSPDFSLSHVGFRSFPAVYNTYSDDGVVGPSLLVKKRKKLSPSQFSRSSSATSSPRLPTPSPRRRRQPLTASPSPAGHRLPRRGEYPTPRPPLPFPPSSSSDPSVSSAEGDPSLRSAITLQASQ